MNFFFQTSSSPPGGSIKSPQQTLRRLFLMLFLRGHSSRGLQLKKVPGSIGQKLAISLTMYVLFGCVAFAFVRLPIFTLAVYLHATTFAFLGMFLASSMGEVLFNKEEADILLHRPISPGILLRAKIRVLFEVSLWMAGAFNLAGFVAGFMAAGGGWRFVLAHIFSIGLEAAFCAGCVVTAYQLCLRWCGRERLEGLITTAQVMLSIGAVLASQILPQLLMRDHTMIAIDAQSWCVVLFPPAWFASLDNVISGQLDGRSLWLSVLAISATVVVLWIAFVRLASEYGTGMQRLGEAVAMRPRKSSRRRWIDRAINAPPLRWCLPDPVARASFLLTAAYLVRDRDVKLRIYPAIAPMMIMPIAMLLQAHGRDDGFMDGYGLALSGSMLGLVPMMGVSSLQYSQQWPASEVFRTAPLKGPKPLCDGARWATLCFLTFPVIAVLAAVFSIMQRSLSHLPLLLPSLIALPVFAFIPHIGGACIPLSRPIEEAKGANQGLAIFGAIIPSFALSGLAFFAWAADWFLWFLLIESIVMVSLYAVLHLWLANRKWPKSE